MCLNRGQRAGNAPAMIGFMIRNARVMMFGKAAWRQLVMLGLAGLLVGCSGDDKALLTDKPVDQLYSEAAGALGEGDYKNAAKNFEEVERQYPYSSWATKAQLMAAYAQYQGGDYDSTITTLDRFIQLHPGNADIAYAFYLRAVSFYERIAEINRDQTNTREAEKALQDIVSRFPDTPYARDALVKIALVQDQLAGAEMDVGRYYLKRKIYNAALPRFQRVVEQHQTTSQAPEALHRMVECYLALGIKAEAQATAAVLGHNFPGSQWYAASYALLGGAPATVAEQANSWIGRVWKKMF
jgi:outer membrane protein assembly factor BamD